ncbi:MAG TPA: amino acid adenylation domain-containing protein [Longimicrobium sp.]|nr:amino acid adenylation domain-containing protein [Longimicrobium sp.]
MPSQQAPTARPPELSAAKRALLEGMLESQRRPSTLERRARTGAIRLSFAQERLYFLHRMQAGSAAYNVQMRLRLQGRIDHAALERALGEVVRRHEALRTTFHEQDGVPVQVVEPFADFVLPVEELSGRTAAEREGAKRRAGEEAERPFDLAAGPLFRGTLLRLDAEEHELLLGMHHIVTDGWSLDVLQRELSAIYAAYAAGGESPLPEPALQYADFAVWQREQMRGGALGRQLAWWRERLAGAPELLALPTDRPRPAARAQRGRMVHGALPAGVLARLTALARGEGATLFMVLLGVFQALLAKYAGSDDVVVGTPVSGRTRRETEDLIGCFVNTLVLRTELGGDLGFREVVRRVRRAALGAYDHQEVPFERLVAALRPERSLGHSPLFQLMFTLDEADAAAGPPLPGLAVRRIGGEKETTKFDLTLTCSRRGTALETRLEYDTDLFDRETAERMLAHFVRLAEQVAEDPDRRLSGVELLTEAERDRVLNGWNGTARAYPPDRCIHQLIEAQAKRTPAAVALVHEGGRITYAALNGAANRLARELRGRGVGRGGFVPILAERGPHAAVAMLATMKAGAAFVPLDAAWPGERLRAVLDLLRAPLLLAGEGVLDQARALGCPVLAVTVDGEDAPNPECGAGPGDPIYAIFTSGSTGVPKGAVVPHGGIANRFHWMTEHFGAPAARSVLQTTRHVYDSAVWQLFWPLTTDGRTVIPSAGGEADAHSLAELIRAEAVTMADFVPSVFDALVPELAADAGARERLGSLRTVVVGGEQITAETTHRFMACFPHVRVVNLYGPTECSIGSVHHAVSREDGGRIPIGRPIANTSALILDRGGRLVPPGVVGEIHLGGRCVGLGYLGDARRTSAAFVPNPYAPRGGGRLYRTGDLGRYRADGRIECLGRLDEQVKIRGVRVEPGEIEAALLQFPGVRGALVLAREAAPGERRLVAYVAAGEPEAVPAAALRGHLRARLPDAMVPAAFVVLAVFPLTAGGKVDRRALPAPRWEAGGAYVAPRTPAEEILTDIWGEVLGVERVGIHDGFFDLGGHSLLATRVISRIRQAFGAEVPLRALFEHPTVAGLAERVQAALASGGGARPLPLRRVPRDGDPVLSFGQERLWQAYRRNPADTSFNLHYGLRVRGELDARTLGRALTGLVRRHEVLRTTFRDAGGRVAQVVHPPHDVPLRVADLRALPAAGREAALQALAEAEAARRFDLERGPLLRAVLVRARERELALLLTLHHVVTDGWSTGVLMRELSELYAYAAGREPALPEPEVQYADYAAWQRAWLSAEVLDPQLAYWKDRLAGAPRLALATDRPRLAGARGWAAVRTFGLGEDLSHAVRALARREGCTLYMAFLAGFAALLARVAGQEDVCVGTPVAGRVRREVEGLIGFFTNTLVIRADLSGAPGFRTLMKRVRETTLGAYGHQDVPFARLASTLRPGTAPEEMPLFQVVFELEHARAAHETLRLPGADVSVLPRSPGARRTLRSELRLNVLDGAARIEGSLWYRTELFDLETIDGMIRGYLALLEAAVADPDRPLADLPLPAAVEGGIHARIDGRASATVAGRAPRHVPVDGVRDEGSLPVEPARA